MNPYVTLELLKSQGVMDISGGVTDGELLRLAEAIARQMDQMLNRSFYVLEQTKVFAADGRQTLFVPDLVSITTLKTDDNRDRTFETTWATTDYITRPYNADPTTRSNPQSRPITAIDVDSEAGTKAAWPPGVRAIEIVGQWGWWRHLVPANEVVNGSHTAATTTLKLDVNTDVKVGHTLLIGSEQLYVTNIHLLNATVIRGVNGTTAASMSGSETIQVYEYPSTIQEASIALQKYYWTRKDANFASSVGFPDGTFQSFSSLPLDIKTMMSSFKKLAI